jgi:hypothetical protein
MFEHESIWLNGKEYPLPLLPMAGGAPEGDGIGGGVGVMDSPTDGGSYFDDAPEDVDDDETEEGTEETTQEQPQDYDLMGKLGIGNQQPAPHQQVQGPPPPMQQLQQRAQVLQMAPQYFDAEWQKELQVAEAHFQYLPEEKQQELRAWAVARKAEYDQAKLRAQGEFLQVQHQMMQAQYEPIAADGALNELAKIIKKDFPKTFDEDDFRSEIAAYQDHGAGSVLVAAQNYARRLARQKTQETVKKGTYKMGTGSPATTNSLEGKSVSDLLSMGIKDMERRLIRKRR